jgi:hypothetical protein
MVNAHGKYSLNPYKNTWKNLKNAFEEALRKYPDNSLYSTLISNKTKLISPNSTDNFNKNNNKPSINEIEKKIVNNLSNDFLSSIEELIDKSDRLISNTFETKSQLDIYSEIKIDDLREKILKLSDKINITKEQISTEEATKMAFILPFIKLLEYDVFNHTEVQPELTADIGIKKGEKVDYGIFNNNKLIMIIECKHWEENLNIHKSQLHRYFHVTSTKIAVLTNGINYKFYTDIEEPNKMDFEPFFEFNILNITEDELKGLSLLKKSCFNLEQILNQAQFYKNTIDNEYKEKIIKILMNELQEPSPSFVKHFVTQFCKKENINDRSIEYFSKIVKNSLIEFKNGI